jgi:Phage integrase family
LHDLRRTFAGDLLEAGYDLVKVQRAMGHSDPIPDRPLRPSGPGGAQGYGGLHPRTRGGTVNRTELVARLGELVKELTQLIAEAHDQNLAVWAEVRSARKTLGRWVGDLQSIIPPER